jgi:hypothetical protein
MLLCDGADGCLFWCLICWLSVFLHPVHTNASLAWSVGRLLLLLLVADDL